MGGGIRILELIRWGMAKKRLGNTELGFNLHISTNYGYLAINEDTTIHQLKSKHKMCRCVLSFLLLKLFIGS